MESSQINDTYKVFPYRRDFANGRTNVGGIDLVAEPERIDEIIEALTFPELRQLLIELNSPNSSHMTLGCLAEMGEDAFYGYIEFSFRDSARASDEKFIADVDRQFYAWLQMIIPEMVEDIIASTRWEYSWFSYLGSAERLKITFYYRALDQRCSGQLVDLLRKFLLGESQRSILMPPA